MFPFRVHLSIENQLHASQYGKRNELCGFQEMKSNKKKSNFNKIREFEEPFYYFKIENAGFKFISFFKFSIQSFFNSN